MASIYLNHFSTAYLIAGSFTGIAALLCLSIKNRSDATLHLGITFASGAMVYLSLVVLQSLYHPYAVAARWVTTCAPLAFQIHAAQFLLRFPNVTHPRITRGLLIGQWIFVIVLTVGALTILRRSGVAFVFEAHAWDYTNFEIPRLVALCTFANAMILYIVGIWRCFVLKGKDRTVLISLLVSFFIVTFLPGLGNVMIREGQLDRGIFLTMFAILSVIAYFLIAVLYINHARDQTSFMTKIIGISLATFLLVLQLLGHYFLKDRDLSYDEAHARDARIYALTNEKTDDFQYALYFEPGKETVVGEKTNPGTYSEQFINTWTLEKLLNQKTAADALRILESPEAGPYFTGHRKSLTALISGLSGAEFSSAILRHLQNTERLLVTRSNKIRQMPDATFRSALTAFISNQPNEFKPFAEAIQTHLSVSKSDGAELKSEVLKFISPMHRVGVRHFRHGITIDENYSAFMVFDSNKTHLIEVGFSYLGYRTYLHQAAIRIALILFLILITVLLGFRLFFLGTLVNPLRTLLSGVHRVNQGDLSFTPKAKVEDEIGFLTKSFNRMVWSIRNEKRRVEKHTDHLEEMVNERTSDLELAKEKLIDADKQKTAFFQNISHELRTPLTLILGPLETATRSGKNLDQQTRDIMHFNAKRLLQHVNQLLDLQKVAAGKMTLNRRAVDLAAFLKMTSGAFEPYVESKGLKIKHEIPSDLPLADVDIDAIDKCIYNYLSNALKFTPVGGTITIGAALIDGFIRVRVSDTGRGVPADKLPFLFQRFGYSEASLTKEQEGTGLGLALVAELIELHGGKVQAESKAGEGSTFSFSVPIADEHTERLALDNVKIRSGDMVQRTVTEISVDSPIKMAPGSAGKVLLAEDNSDLRMYMKGILVDAGCFVVEAANGQVALDRLSEFKPDLLITDLMMPVMSGVDLVRNMRAMSHMKTVPVILLTAKADEETRREVRDAGADIYLSKPFNDNEFVSAVRNLLSLKSREQALLRDLEIARELQLRLLPARLPDRKRVRLATRFLPMEQVGGDLYDIVEGPNGEIGIFVGDVSGHGVPAAMIARMTKLALHTALIQFPPANEVLSKMNSLLLDRTGSHHVTATFLSLNPETGLLSFSNAGHPPILICRASGCEYHHTTNLFLAFRANIELSLQSIQLSTGDRVFAYTDACTEAHNADWELFEDERFAELVKSTLGLDLEEQMDAIVTAIEKFRGGGERQDDLTMVALEFR